VIETPGTEGARAQCDALLTVTRILVLLADALGAI
jgi:hypothetical protein